jgi:septation ring formation regulator EzrA
VSRFNKETETHLIELLEKELALFEKMKELGNKQAEFLAADEIEEFDNSLVSAEKLKEKINGLHQESDTLMQSYISSTGLGGRGKVRQIEEVRDKIRNALKECMELNEKNRTTASNKMTGYSDRIKELDKSRKTFGAYAIAIPDNSEHFDTTT